MTPMLAAVHGGDLAVFIVGAALCGIGTLALLLARNAIHAAAGFALTIFGIAVLFVEQQANLLAGLAVLLGIGAVASVLLLTAMYANADGTEERERFDVRRSVIVLAGGGLFVLLLALVDWSFNHTGKPAQNAALSGPGDDAGKIADFIVANYPVALLAVGATALVAAVVATLWTAANTPAASNAAPIDAAVVSEGEAP